MMQTVEKAARALSDETRLRILALLLTRECCVCEVMQTLEISQTRASRNLGILQEAGFLTVRREGQWSLYAIDKTLNPVLQPLLQAVETSSRTDTQAQADKARLSKACRIGTACAAIRSGTISKR